jgi:hypothetical protein
MPSHALPILHQETTMEKIAVFTNDAAYARHILQPMLHSADATHWVLVACPPHFSRHIGRWVSRDAHEQWRTRWAAELFDALEPELKANPRSQVEKLLAKRPLVTVAARLEARLGPLRLLDARQPRLGRIDEPITTQQPEVDTGRWVAPLAITTGLTAVLALAD